MSTTKEESRKHPRFKVKVQARATIGQRVLEALTRDISGGGICLLLSEELEPGTVMELSLALLLGHNSFSESLELSGKVVWCTPIEDEGFQTGVMFVAVDPQTQGYLEMFLRFLQQELVVQLPDEPEEAADGPDATADE